MYFGGGTPSYLGPDRLTKLLRTLRKRCPVARDAEITLEANPDSACDVKALRALRRVGFNRISLGVQSADDGLLRAIGRIHTFAQVQEAVAAVRGEATAQEAADAIRLASRQYAKRQLTWLRRDAQLFWLRHEKTPDMDLACRRSTQFLAGRGIE